MKTNTILLLILLVGNLTYINAQASYEVADKQFEIGAYDLALQSYQNANALDDAEGSIQIARCYAKMGDTYNAMTSYQTARSLAPSDASFSIEFANILIQNGEYQEALTEAEFASVIDPYQADHIRAYISFALEQMSQGSDREAHAATGNTSFAEFAPRVINDRLMYCSDNESIQLASLDSPELLKSGNHTIVTEGHPYTPSFANLNTRTNIEAISKADNGTYAYALSTSSCPSFACRSKLNSIYFSEVENNDLINTSPYPYNDVTISNTDPYLTADGTTLYFASDRPGGYGGFDIYVSNYDGYGWSMPQNLGEGINTSGDERTPFLATDGFIYFASNYHLGMGGFDIFKAQSIGDGYLDPQNLGIGINSAADELYPFVHKDNVYFSSDRITGAGREDIYKAKLINRDNLISFYDDIPQAVTIQADYKPASTITSDVVITTPIEEPAPIARTVSEETTKPVIYIDPNPASKQGAEVAITTDTELTTTAPPVFKIPVFKSHHTSGGPHPEMIGATQVSLGSMKKSSAALVYFVQVAALYNSSSSLDGYESLTRYGNVYTVQASRARKVRVGYFLDENEAQQALSTIKGQGYSDAFIVSDPLNTDALELIYTATSNYGAPTSTYTPSSTGTTSNTATTYEETPATDNYDYSTENTSSTSVYKVRLASYEDPIWFDGRSVEDIGQIEQWSKGGWTIFILSGYNGYDAAEMARIKAINRGFVDAEVVIDNDGVIERLKKN